MAVNRATKLYELYKSMGPTRSLPELAKVSGVDITTIEAFAEAGDWEIKIRMDLSQGVFDEEAKELAEKVTKLQKTLFGQITSALALMDSCSVGLPFDITSAKDFSAIAKAYETLVKASLIAKTAFVPQGGGGIPDSWLDLVKEVYASESISEDE